jgi:hypothetical protein
MSGPDLKYSVNPSRTHRVIEQRGQRHCHSDHKRVREQQQADDHRGELGPAVLAFEVVALPQERQPAADLASVMIHRRAGRSLHLSDVHVVVQMQIVDVQERRRDNAAELPVHDHSVGAT